ncbi:hypothetical protein [Kibdelosporangium aridum]|uniref:hypothetical protein n=1 Tax=Kibdelosporangium aridum TaxID=2030 RepID=UPI0035ECF0D3
MSDRFATSLANLGVENRHSVLANFPDVLAKGSDPEVTVTGTRLAAQAVRPA